MQISALTISSHVSISNHKEITLQIRAGQRSITANLWPLTAHIYHVMIIVTSSFSKNSFFINIIFISYKFFRTIL